MPTKVPGKKERQRAYFTHLLRRQLSCILSISLLIIKSSYRYGGRDLTRYRSDDRYMHSWCIIMFNGGAIFISDVLQHYRHFNDYHFIMML